MFVSKGLGPERRLNVWFPKNFVMNEFREIETKQISRNSVLREMAYLVLQNGTKRNELTQKSNIYPSDSAPSHSPPPTPCTPSASTPPTRPPLSFSPSDSTPSASTPPTRPPPCHWPPSAEWLGFGLRNRRNSDETVVSSVLFHIPRNNFFARNWEPHLHVSQYSVCMHMVASYSLLLRHPLNWQIESSKSANRICIQISFTFSLSTYLHTVHWGTMAWLCTVQCTCM